jgi:hypothetical protein
MSDGIVLYAYNNKSIDYASIAYVSAKYAQKNLEKPVTIITDQGSIDWLYTRFPESRNFFDKVIITDYDIFTNVSEKRYYDGSLSYKNLEFKNINRSDIYNLTPYEKTLVIDSDLLITNNSLKHVWASNETFMISKNHYDLAINRDSYEFKYVSEFSVDFYWATAFYFVKNQENKIFFDLCEHIKENYDYYRLIYRINYPVLRNDFVFSIAIHIMHGFSNLSTSVNLPVSFYYILDRDDLYDVIDEKTFIFLTAKRDYLGEYNLVKTSNKNLHIMNKYGFSRNIDKMLGVLT